MYIWYTTYPNPWTDVAIKISTHPFINYPNRSDSCWMIPGTVNPSDD